MTLLPAESVITITRTSQTSDRFNFAEAVKKNFSKRSESHKNKNYGTINFEIHCCGFRFAEMSRIVGQKESSRWKYLAQDWWFWSEKF